MIAKSSILLKALFFFKAYSLKDSFSLLALFLFEISGLPRKKWQPHFSSTLVESRSILGFIFNNSGTARSSNSSMLISLQFKGRRIALKLRWNSSDFLAFEQIFIKEEYAPLVHSALKSPVIVDAGANIGCTTIYLKVVYPSATILSIEADPGNFEILKENIKLNGFDGIMPMHVALWYFNGTVQLARNYRDNRDWSVTVSKKGDVSVSSQTFETILLANPGSIDILKMDIEGAEIEIFRNDSLIGDTLRKVKYLAVEVHDDLENLVENKLNEVGFDVFNQGESLFGRNTRI